MTSTLSQILARLDTAELRGSDPALDDVTHDSRSVADGALFCAIPGDQHDGHDFAGDAVKAGASALMVERWLDLAVPQLRVPSVRQAMAHAAAVVHGDPTRQVRLIGVTGTNGKTTVSYLVEAALAASGHGVGVIGTVEARVHGEPLGGTRTTPESTDLQRLVAMMRARGADSVVVEVSSHGLDLHRVDACEFDVAVFTNLSQDHLDWHGSMEAYFAAKRRLFDSELSARAVINIDDDWGRRLAADVGVDVVTVGRANADVTIRAVRTTSGGSEVDLSTPWGEVGLSTSLAGVFNVDNAVLAYVAAVVSGIDATAAAAGIAACGGAPGRMERVDAGQGFEVFVDYAHTPAALSGVVFTGRALTSPNGQKPGRVIVVAGAGGERDRDKRPAMGMALADADVVILTSDNPRSEDPEAILAALAGGVAARTERHPEVHTVEDRRQAIALALEQAAVGDVVIIAGKGHETTQQIGDQTVEFDDRVVAATLLSAMGGATS
ncbi:MAG: UDP-N-acetylmuramoyl-L-alanyl-D-glutamate--2,6-diaminopimelate ligase [Nitriliruptoraceae bacterium]